MSTRVKSFAVGALALTIAAAVQAQPEKERVIIGFKAGSAAQIERAVSAAGGKKEVDLQRFDAVAVSVPAQALKGLQNNPNVLYVEEDTRRQLLSTEFEPGKPYGIEMVQADLVSDGVAGNRKVCIIDSGYDLGHPDLQSVGVDGVYDSGTGNWYTDENGHGTHVAELSPRWRMVKVWLA